MFLKLIFLIFFLLSVNCFPLENIAVDTTKTPPTGNDGGLSALSLDPTMCGPDCVWVAPICRPPGYLI